jgi:hypothetical protein
VNSDELVLFPTSQMGRTLDSVQFGNMEDYHIVTLTRAFSATASSDPEITSRSLNVPTIQVPTLIERLLSEGFEVSYESKWQIHLERWRGSWPNDLKPLTLRIDGEEIPVIFE